MKSFLAGCLLIGITTLAAAADAPLKLHWESGEKDLLTITGDHVPGGTITVWYIEAYCRAGSTDADWLTHTKIPHRTKLIEASDDGTRIKLRCQVTDGLVVDHVITSQRDEVDFRLTAHNPTDTRSEALWAQPCMRVDKFTGGDRQTYLPKCFVFLDGKLERMPTRDWATTAYYTPGQVWVPKGIDLNNVNPRPLNKHVPSNGLIGCYSQDESMICATAYEPYQELFQGIIACLHSDYRLDGLMPRETKHLRGKIYIVPNDVEALLARYQKDFPEQLNQ